MQHLFDYIERKCKKYVLMEIIYIRKWNVKANFTLSYIIVECTVTACEITASNHLIIHTYYNYVDCKEC